ncbi:uncharacterized protein [Littorina saxatilis]|uniref:Uncharacterized protein n=2 Tax=Littorina saxatilis TaxID=31220 RepID=A0AAN9BMC3_9CAEN
MLKFALLMMLPLAFTLPQKRLLLGDFVDLNKLHGIVSTVAHKYGGDPTEQECETSCHGIMASEQSLGHTWCPAVCRSFQELMHVLDIQPTSKP